MPRIVSTSSCSTLSFAFQRKSVLETNSPWRSRVWRTATMMRRSNPPRQANGNLSRRKQLIFQWFPTTIYVLSFCHLTSPISHHNKWKKRCRECRKYSWQIAQTLFYACQVKKRGTNDMKNEILLLHLHAWVVVLIFKIIIFLEESAHVENSCLNNNCENHDDEFHYKTSAQKCWNCW